MRSHARLPSLTAAAQVRTLAVAPAPLLISGSRDTSAIVWALSSDGKSWAPQRTIRNPDSKFVSSVAWVEAGGVCENRARFNV